jgi:GPH family glycoside/pentoside/hexuronide:cation symporter
LKGEAPAVWPKSGAKETRPPWRAGRGHAGPPPPARLGCAAVAERLSLRRRIAYALGAPGFQITDRIVVAIAIFYYLPPGDSDLVPQVSEATFLGVLTAFGAARLLGGLFDSLADPLVGWASDRSRSRLGRRRVFLLAGIGPMVLAPVLLFFPPGAPGSVANFAWLTVLLAIYYVFFTAYVGPYLALLPEIAPEERERVGLSTLLAVAGVVIVGLYAAGWLAGVEAGRRWLGLDTEQSLRVVVVASSLVAFVLCLGPIVAVDERRLARTSPVLSMREALGPTLRNRPFLLYLGAQILFVLGITMIGPMGPYYALAVAGRDEAFAALLALAPGPGVFLGFWLVGRAAARFGPKRTLVVCAAALGVLFALQGLLVPDVPGGPHDRRNLLILFGVGALWGVPAAGFMVLPHVVLGQLIDLDAARTGAHRAAMYFGAQGLFTKWAYGVAAALLSWLFVTYGNSSERATGILLVGPVAGALCLLSACLYTLYPEREVRAAQRALHSLPAPAGKASA